MTTFYKNSLTITVLVLLLTHLTSCGPPQIDGESEESFQNSLEKIKEDLEEDKSGKLDTALMVIAFAELDIDNILQADEDDFSAEAIRERLDGKTANEIFTMKERIQKKREIERKQEELESWVELKEKKAQAEEEKEKLQDFEVLESEFFFRYRRYGNDEPIIALDVVNNTDHAISRAYFNGVIKSPDRAVPWLEERFNYEISGGVEPGDEASWGLGPNPDSEWGKVDPPEDAEFNVEVIRLDGPGGEVLYDATGLDSFEEGRLEEFKEEYGSEEVLQEEIEEMEEELENV